MNVPNTSNPDSIPYYLNDKAKQASYRMYSNSKSIIDNYGFSVGANYVLNTWTVGANTTFAQLKNTENKDGLEDGFNTPEWMLNLAVSKKNIVKALDATLSYKWQMQYYTATFLVNGTTPAYGCVDAQTTFHFPKIMSSIKVGASNLLNKYYVSYLGGPSVGGLYYVTFTYGIQ